MLDPSAYYLKNPVSGEIKLVVPSIAKMLRRYGWTDTNAAEYLAWKSAQVEYITRKFVTGLRLH